MGQQVELLDAKPIAEPATRPAEVAQPSEGATMLAIIDRASRDPAVDVDKLDRLLQMAERVNARNAEQAFNEAMTAAQEGMRPIRADSDNPQTKSKYASYPALDRVVRPIYTKHGFALSFGTGDAPSETMVKVLCHVSHSSGHSRNYHIDMPADGKGAKGADVMTRTHATGAALSYAQRYLLKLIFNLSVGDDDDGNGADVGSGLVTPDQLRTLRDMIERIGNVDMEAFCKFLKVEALPDLPAKDFEKAVIALNMKERKKS